MGVSSLFPNNVAMNRVVHFEIHADDLERAKKFYSSVFGWEIIQMGGEYGNYVILKSGAGADEPVDPKNPGINGGMMQRNAASAPKGASPNAYVCIIGVDNIDIYMKKMARQLKQRNYHDQRT